MAKLTTIDSLVALLVLTDGRDKLFKTMQYTIKVFFTLMEGTSIKIDNIRVGFGNLAKSLSSARRVFRLGNYIKSFLTIKDAFYGSSSSQKLLVRNCDLASAFCGIGSCVCDDFGWLQLSWNGKSTKLSSIVESYGDTFWAISTVFDSIVLLSQLSETKATKWTDIKMQVLSLIKLQADFLFASSSGFSMNFNDLALGISGLTSGSIGLYKVWSKVKKR